MANGKLPTDKPYVAYRVEMDVKEKGIGINFSRGLRDLFAHQGIRYHIREEVMTSGRYECVVSLFPSDNADSIMQQMLRVADNGKMPSNRKWKPDVTITPILQEQTVVEAIPAERYNPENANIETQNNEEVRQLTSEKLALEEKLAEQEAATIRLRGELAARQTNTQRFSTPLESLITTYLPSGAELAELLSVEYQLLSDNDDLDLIGKALMTFSEYVKHKKGVAFVPEMLKVAAEAECWDDLEEARALLAKQEQRERDAAGLARAAESGMSDAVLSITRRAIAEQYSRLDEEIAGSRHAFAAVKRIASEIPALEKQYDDLAAALGNLEERTSATLPIIATEVDGAAHIYFPKIEGPLRDAILQELKADAVEMCDGATHFVIQKPTMATERFLNNKESSRTASFLRGFGVVAKITRV